MAGNYSLDNGRIRKNNMDINGLIREIQRFEDKITLKKNYAHDKQMISNFANDINVMAHLNAPRHKIIEARNTIKRILDWIRQEDQR